MGARDTFKRGHIAKLNISGDDNLGLLGICTDEFCLMGNHLAKSYVKIIRDVLGVPVLQLSIAGSQLIGIFAAGNSKGIVLPHISSREDVKRIKSAVGCNVEMLHSKCTALGNLVLANDSGAVASRLLGRADVEKIKECLGVRVEYGTVAGTDLVGSGAVATNRGLLANNHTTEQEMKHIEDVLSVKGDYGTANFGSPWVGGCVLANSNGMVAGSATTIHEITRMDEALGFLQGR